jgi:hypothetical protein
VFKILSNEEQTEYWFNRLLNKSHWFATFLLQSEPYAASDDHIVCVSVWSNFGPANSSISRQPMASSVCTRISFLISRTVWCLFVPSWKRILIRPICSVPGWSGSRVQKRRAVALPGHGRASVPSSRASYDEWRSNRTSPSSRTPSTATQRLRRQRRPATGREEEEGHAGEEALQRRALPLGSLMHVAVGNEPRRECSWRTRTSARARPCFGPFGPSISHLTVSDEPGKDGCSLSRTFQFTLQDRHLYYNTWWSSVSNRASKYMCFSAFPNPVSVEKEFTNKGTWDLTKEKERCCGGWRSLLCRQRSKKPSLSVASPVRIVSVYHPLTCPRSLPSPQRKKEEEIHPPRSFPPPSHAEKKKIWIHQPAPEPLRHVLTWAPEPSRCPPF